MSNKNRKVIYPIVLALAICAVLMILIVQTAKQPLYYEYVYAKENHAGETDYMVTNMDEDRISEKYPTDNWTLAAKYPVSIYKDAEGNRISTQIQDVTGGVCLIWDAEWFLWDMETEEKTPLSLPLSDCKRTTVQLLGDTEPVIVALMNEEHTAAGFFSIEEDRMITGWDFEGWGDDLINGQIAARIGQYEEEKWVLVDPATGEITGSLPGRPENR